MKHFRKLSMLDLEPDSPSRCEGVIQAHHLMKPFYSSRGMGMRAGDKDIIPLCEKHHRNLHMLGNEYKFFEMITNNARFGILSAQRIWMSSPHYEK